MKCKLSVAILLMFLAGCQSAGPEPTEGDAQAVWHHVATQNHVEGVRELVSLHKTNGQLSTIQGTTVYTFAYEAKVRYLVPLGKWKTGDIQTVDSNYGFQKTEKGWQGPDGMVYAD